MVHLDCEFSRCGILHCGALPINMANPFAALGNILQGKSPDGHTYADIFEAVQEDDATAVEKFLSRGGRINDLNQVRSCSRVPSPHAGGWGCICAHLNQSFSQVML